MRRAGPRGLSASELALWAKVAETVTPLPGRRLPPAPPQSSAPAKSVDPAHHPHPAKPEQHPGLPAKGARKTPIPAPHQAPVGGSLDSHWERRFRSGRIEPDLTLDLHDHSLDAAYTRIMAGLDQARSMGARVVLVIAGRERPVDPADRQTRRGAIRAKLLDWLAASHHADSIAAVRRAHRSHGGEGALYLVLKRRA
ncbi:MAG: Smr/MutS family protein [Erythrobacter sp.]